MLNLIGNNYAYKILNEHVIFHRRTVAEWLKVVDI